VKVCNPCLPSSACGRAAAGYGERVNDAWSKQELRRRTKRAGVYPLGVVIAGSVVAYFLADLVTAMLIFVALAFATLAGLALGLKIADWYSDLMNKPWGRSR
jgi:hypothetical protein